MRYLFVIDSLPFMYVCMCKPSHHVFPLNRRIRIFKHYFILIYCICCFMLYAIGKVFTTIVIANDNRFSVYHFMCVYKGGPSLHEAVVNARRMSIKMRWTINTGHWLAIFYLSGFHFDGVAWKPCCVRLSSCKIYFE